MFLQNLMCPHPSSLGRYYLKRHNYLCAHYRQSVVGITSFPRYNYTILDINV